jgi:anthranilate/para-aminobenzoate synthase component II
VGLFAGLPQPFEATRYHSLVVDRASVPPELEVTAWTDDGVVMGLRHRRLAVEGVQFHPESILTASGHDMLRTFLAGAGQPAERSPSPA